MNLEALWNYMQIENEVAKFETAMQQSPKRKLLLKNRDLLKELRDSIAKMEADVSSMNDRLEALKEEYSRLSALVAQHKEKLEKEPPKTPEEIKERMDAIIKLVDTLSRYEQEIAKISKDADNKEHQQKNIRIRAAKTKPEYDAAKAEYDKEFAADSLKLKALRSKVEEEAAKLDQKDLEKYKTVRSHVTPPMARVMDNQCSGCFMGLSIGTIGNLKGAGEVTLCDNCGRILYAKD